MNLRTWKRHLQADILSGNACMAISHPGVGKSQVSVQMAYWYRDYIKASQPTARVGLAVFFLAVSNPTGVGGLPWKGQRTFVDPRTGESTEITVTDPAVPQWYMCKCLDTGEILPASCFDKVVCIIEEWGQGAPETKRACAELALSGEVAGWKLPVGSPRILLTNSDSRDGVTKEFGFINNRVTKRNIVGDAEILLDDFADHPYPWQGRTWQMLGASKLWIKRNPGIVFEERPKDDGQWCTARSFTAMDRYVQVMMELNGGKIPLDDPTFTEGCAGYVGMRAVQSYVVHLKMSMDIASYEDVVSDPLGTPVPVKADEQMLLAYELAGRAQRGDLDKILRFMEKRDANGHGMPRDMNVCFVTTLKRRDYSFLREPAVDRWINQNAYLMAIISKLA